MKLYRNSYYPKRWYAFSPATSWVMFPAEAGGWAKREPARGADPLYLREVPLHLGYDAGIPGAPGISAEILASAGEPLEAAA